MKKLTPLDQAELELLRTMLSQRYQGERGVQLSPTSYAAQYDDLCGRIRTAIKGQNNVDVSSNQLRKLFYDTRDSGQAEFNVIYLTAFARYITEDTSCDYRSWMDRVKADHGKATNGVGAGHYIADTAVKARTENSVLDQIVAETTSEGNGQGVTKIMEGESLATQAEELPLSNAGRSAEDVPVSGAAGSRSATQLSVLLFLRPFLYAALLAGTLTFIFVLTLPEYSGYDPQKLTGLRTLMASFFGFSVFGHLAMGIVTGLLVRWLNHRAGRMHNYRSLLFLAPVVFLATFVFRQLFVRDGWLIKGRDGSGLFGQPDMETLAHAGSFSLCILLLVVIVSTRPSSDMQTKLLRAILVALSCSMVFFTASLLYHHLVVSGVISEGDFIIAPSVLNLEFPHPERLPLVGFMVFVQCFLTLVFVEGKYRHSDKESSPSP